VQINDNTKYKSLFTATHVTQKKKSGSNFCVSIATMVTRTRHNIMLYVHCQPLYFRCWRHNQTLHSFTSSVCYLSLPFCSSSVDVCTFLGCGATSVDDLYPTFRDRVAVSYSRAKMPSDFRTWKIRHPEPVTR